MRVSIPVLLLLTASAMVARSQPATQQQVAPPPLKTITRAERAQLDAAKEDKARIKLTIELAETHLTNVENLTAQTQYEAAAADAGMYWALIDDALAYMKTAGRDNNRRRDLYKRLELALRAHGPRLNAIRRNTPAEYSVWIKEIEDFARNGRTEALNSFYGHTVIPDNPDKSADTKETKKPSSPEN